MQTVVIGKTSKQFKTVKSLILDKKVKEVIIATDAGREGELVARQYWIKFKKPIKRLWISSNKKQFKRDLKSLKMDEFQHLYEAALARSEVD